MSDEEISFKVTDRRLFNTDGSPRELPAEEKSEVKPEATSVEAAVTNPQTKDEPASPVESAPVEQSTSASLPDEAASQHDLENDFPDAEDPASFANFMMSIASNAASSLGMIEHPVTHKREVDLQLGKHWIDVLGMLEAKTRGNLTPQEKQILESLLADLRMQYVSLTSAASAKAAGPYTGRDILGG